MEDDRFIMRSYQTSEGCAIWTEGSIHESKQFFFYETKVWGAFPIQMYDTYDEADKIYKELQLHPHPNFGRVLLRPFQVEDDGIVKAFLALQSQGESLSDLMDRRGSSQKFYDHRILSFYQKILTDLIVVVRYSMSTNLQCDLSLSDVFILEDSDESCPPHLTIMKFKFRGGHGSNTEWSDLATFIQKINYRVSFYKSKEMDALISSLNNPDEENLAKIASLSLFWSTSDRIVFCGNWGDLVDTQLFRIHDELGKPFGDNPSEWKELVRCDPSFAKMEMEPDKKKKNKGLQQLSFSRLRPAEDAMECFKFIRKCLLHLDQMKTPGVVYDTPREVLHSFERIFKDFIYELALHAQFVEKTHNVTIIRRKAGLNNLYFKPS